MEQATNTFNKGLQLDTHPMVQGNDTLTDCLNGTLITMNGNEVILQNDMGNRRVNNAFLPSGYEPVGMKEYGGIIYVAAYNPITNKSQIGSFPSPQLRYGSSSGLKATMSDSLFTEVFTDNLFPGINFQKNFTVLTPFIDGSSSEKVILHAGDKFTVYGGSLIKNEITNYDNVNSDGSKLTSPKNRKYTLSLGVLNSQNEFVDFTESLLRWNSSNQIITFGENIPDYIKFNTGYFIPAGYTDPGLNYTVQDLNFIKNRLKISANTYAYKLIGPLYIKKELNVIEDLTYNVYGNFYKDGNSDKSEIFVETIYEYNCPDGGGGINNNNDKYESFEETQANSSLSLYSTIKIGSNTVSETLVEDTKYNEETNLYKAIKAARCILNQTSGKIDIMIVPRTSNNLGIRNLSYIDTFDIEKLNSNEIELTDFRFYTNLEQQTTKLTVGFKAYPKYRNSFKDLKISIYNYTGGITGTPIKVFEWGESGYNGTKTFVWDWTEKSHFYPVEISYKIESDNPFDSQTEKEVTIKRWIMTTKLLNQCYYSSSDKFVRDYGKSTKVGNSVKFDENIEELLIAKASSINTDVKDNEAHNIYQDGDIRPYKLENEDFESNVLNIYNENIEIDGRFDFDRDLYPLELTINNITVSNVKSKLLNGESEVQFSDYFPSEYTIGQKIYKVETDVTKTISGLTYNLKYTTDLIGRESYSAEVKQKSIVIDKLFTSFYKYLDDNYLPYAAIALDSWDRTGTDQHAIYFSMQDSNSKKICDFSGLDDDGAPYPLTKIINQTGARIDANHDYSFYFPKEKDYINSGIDSMIGNKLFFVGTNNCFMKAFGKVYADLYDEGFNTQFCPPRPIMFWMKTQDGWAILPLLDWVGSDSYGGYYHCLKNGWLGKGGYNNRTYFTDDKVKTYIKSRIKDFYYIGENYSARDLYCIDIDKAPIIVSYNNIITLQIVFSSKITNISETTAITSVLPDGRSELFSPSSQTFENIGYSKNIVFNQTETFDLLVESINEQLNKDSLDVALESNNKLYFSDYSKTVFNPNVMYYKDEEDNDFHPLNISVVYKGTLPLVSPEYEDCGIEWLYATDDSDYFGDDNDESYLYLGGTPTIPKILLKE